MREFALVLLATILVLTACTDKKDLYKQELNRDTLIIKFHIYDSRGDLKKAIGNRQGKAVWSPNDDLCDVHFLRWDFETAGHEVHHCIHGSFHDEKYDESRIIE